MNEWRKFISLEEKLPWMKMPRVQTLQTRFVPPHPATSGLPFSLHLFNPIKTHQPNPNLVDIEVD